MAVLVLKNKRKVKKNMKLFSLVQKADEDKFTLFLDKHSLKSYRPQSFAKKRKICFQFKPH